MGTSPTSRPEVMGKEKPYDWVSADTSRQALVDGSSTRSGTNLVKATDDAQSEHVNHEAPQWYHKRSTLLRNFLIMAVGFSMNHGTIVALVGLARTELNEIGDYLNGSLYFTYVLVALLFSTFIVEKLGAKKAMTLALFVYVSYPLSLLLAYYGNKAKWTIETLEAVAIITAGIGGTAAGFLWTAQGAFFAATSRRYAAATGKTMQEASGSLAGYFAAIYVGSEVLLRLAAGPISQVSEFGVVCAVYVVIAFVAALAVMFIVKPLPQVQAAAGSPTGCAMVVDRSVSFVRLWYKKPVIFCFVWLNMAFGFASALVNSYFTPEVAADDGDVGGNVNYLLAIMPAVAALLSVPFGLLAGKIGHLPLLMLGSCCYMLIGGFLIVYTPQEVTDMGYYSVFIYVTSGVGRSVFEASNRATFADYFPDDNAAAFANIIFWSGAPACIGFLVADSINQAVAASLVVATSSLSVLGVTVALFLKCCGPKPDAPGQNAETAPLLVNEDSKFVSR